MFNVYDSRVSRRLLLATLGATASLATPVMATVAGPGGAGRNDRGSGRDAARGAGSFPTLIIRRSHLRDISDDEVSAAIRMSRAGRRIVVAGFSRRMSRNLLRMMRLRRRRTFNLVRSLETRKTRVARVQRLDAASQSVTDAIFLLDEVEAHEVFFPSRKETLSKVTAIRQLRHYRSLVDIWRRSPMEGTLPTPGLP
ncbi:hypothetical protein [Roseovarius sp.]|uniref:hypothetical protein n=1 Tax=Roseovarius sp. TaxID=1486281 RepID=UPI003BAC2210